MKLELKHIVPHLPYNVDTNHGRLIGVRDWVEWSGVFKNKYGETNIPIKNVKLILRPLSDLTKEIKVDGERFIPIVELARINLSSAIDDSSLEVIEIKSGNGYCYIDYVDGDFGMSYRFYYNYISKVFQVGEINPNKHKPMCRGLDLFQKLYEWHFDVENLIEHKLAIDINALEE